MSRVWRDLRQLTALVCAVSLLAACGAPQPEPDYFVGKWRSTRLTTTPLHMYENGEWEIRDDADVVLQYGLWDYRDGVLTWIYRRDGVTLSRDVNTVIAVRRREFEIRESNGDITTLTRLD